MSEMVDRVAQAIAEEINGGKFDDERWYNDDQRDVHRKRARAAIEAMRKVPDAVILAGMEYDWPHLTDARKGWEDMITEALK